MGVFGLLAAASVLAGAAAEDPEPAALYLDGPGGGAMPIGAYRFACGEASAPVEDLKACGPAAAHLVVIRRIPDAASARLAAMVAAQTRFPRLELKTWAAWDRGFVETLGGAQVLAVQSTPDGGERLVLRFETTLDSALWYVDGQVRPLADTPIPVQTLDPCALSRSSTACPPR